MTFPIWKYPEEAVREHGQSRLPDGFARAWLDCNRSGNGPGDGLSCEGHGCETASSGHNASKSAGSGRSAAMRTTVPTPPSDDPPARPNAPGYRRREHTDSRPRNRSARTRLGIMRIGLLGTMVAAWAIPSMAIAGQAQTTAIDSDFLSAAGDNTLRERIEQALHNEQPGARSSLLGRRVLELNNQDTLARALQNNLDIQTRQRDSDIARFSHEESKAPFDPVLSLSGSFREVDSFERKELISRDRLNPFTLDNRDTRGQIGRDSLGNSASETPLLNTQLDDPRAQTFGDFVCVTIDSLLVNPEQCALQTEFSTVEEFASANARLLNAWQMTAGVSKLFTWGSLLQVQFQSLRKLKSFYPIDQSGIQSQLSTDDPIGRGSTFPWSTSFQTAFNSPLPYSRNFGPFGTTANVGLMVAETGERQAEWTVKAISNGTLREVDGTYWDLVRAYRLVLISAQQRQTLQGLADSSERLFQAGRITTYDRAQIQSDLENSRNLEEIAWNDYVGLSNRLVELLNYAHDIVIVPAAYSGDLLSEVTVDPQDAVATAIVQRPEIRVSQMALEQREILFNFSRTQTRPDVSFTLALNIGQDDRVLGYDSWDASFSNVFNPDFTDLFVGLNFRIPLGNRAVKSQLDQARVAREQARDRVELAQNLVVQDVNQIVTDVYSTRAQVTQTGANLEVAQIAYDKAFTLRDQGMVTDFELLRKLGDLLNARTSHITALVNHRKTRARLLAAKGVLAAQY